MRRGSIIGSICELCLLLSLGSVPALADRATDLDDANQKISSQGSAILSGYVPWKDMIQSLKDSDFDGILAIHWTSGLTTYSNGFKHPRGEGQSDVSSGSMLLLSEIMDCVPSNKGCKSQALFGPAGTSSNAASSNKTLDLPGLPFLGVAGLAANAPVSTKATLPTPESGSAFLLALGLAGLSPIFLRRKKAA